MISHICLSQQAKQLDRWRQTFPDGHIVGSPEDLPAIACPALLWLHSHHSDDKRIDQAIGEAKETFPDSRIVVITNTPHQREALLALHGGAAGYCHAQATAKLFRQVAAVVSNGGLWIGTELMDRLLAATGQLHSVARAPQPLAQLTPREQEVALAVGRGISNKEVAVEFDISERTVKAHLSAIFEKLGVRDRLQLVVFLGRNGLSAEQDPSPAPGAFT